MKWFSMCLIIGILSIGESVVADSFYETGKEAGTGLGESAWYNLGQDCSIIPTFVQLIEEGIYDAAKDLQTKYHGNSAKNFGYGYQAGLSNVLNKVRRKCHSRSSVRRLLDDVEQVANRQLGYGKTTTQPSSQQSSFYNLGKETAQELANSAWYNLRKSCYKISTFTQLLEDSMDDVTGDIGIKYTGQSANDFAIGYLEGLSSALSKVRRDCPYYKTAYKIASCRIAHLEKQVSDNERNQLESFSNTTRSFYNMGKDLAKSEARTAWKNIGSKCTKSKTFVKLIQQSIDDAVADIGRKYNGSSAHAFGSGYLAALSGELRQVRCQCWRDKKAQSKLDWLLSQAALKLNSFF
ncbi:MAG: hypothetical protein KAI17_05320 [Thiotrichaceae bacterium]|nr:hypothetical protein [Thiotrichaceae bacterium]